MLVMHETRTHVAVEKSGFFSDFPCSLMGGTWHQIRSLVSSTASTTTATAPSMKAS